MAAHEPASGTTQSGRHRTLAEGRPARRTRGRAFAATPPPDPRPGSGGVSAKQPHERAEKTHRTHDRPLRWVVPAPLALSPPGAYGANEQEKIVNR